MAEAFKIAMVLGSAREGRIGIRVAKFLKKEFEKKRHEVHLIDPMELNLPILYKAYHHYPNPDDAPSVLQEVFKKMNSSDAFVIVTAEYNHSLPPGLVNIIDHFPFSTYRWKPSAIACYSIGPFGGVRAAMQARALLAEIGTVTIPVLFPVPEAHKNFTEDGSPCDDRLLASSSKFIDDLVWYTEALKKQRLKGVPYQ